MELCNKCDIVFDERNCPLCIAKDKIHDLEEENERILNQLEDSQNKEN